MEKLNDVYTSIIETVKFKDYFDFEDSKKTFMNYLKTIFSDDSDFEDLKLIGSAATGTMRKGSGDLDFFIIFSNEKDILKFDKKMRSTNLDITKTKIEEAYGYIKVSGKFNNYNFVVVPIKNPVEK